MNKRIFTKKLKHGKRYCVKHDEVKRDIRLRINGKLKDMIMENACAACEIESFKVDQELIRIDVNIEWVDV